MNQTGKDEIDEQLKQLALVAQQHPPLTRERQIALRQLVNQILQSGRLCRPQSGQFSGVYQLSRNTLRDRGLRVFLESQPTPLQQKAIELLEVSLICSQ